jgi:hypothetical protein
MGNRIISTSPVEGTAQGLIDALQSLTNCAATTPDQIHVEAFENSLEEVQFARLVEYDLTDGSHVYSIILR